MPFSRAPARTAILTAGTAIGVACATVLFAAPAGAAPPTVTFNAAGVLSIIGDATSNAFVVGSTPTGVVTLNGTPVLNGTVNTANVTSVHMEGRDGNDTLRFQAGSGISARPAEFLGGNGNDDFVGGSAADTLIGGDGVDSFTGNGGADTIDGGRDNDKVTGGTGNDVVRMGEGSDQYTWNSGDGSDRVDADAGKDTLLFNAGAVDDELRLNPDGSRVQLFIPAVTPGGGADLRAGGFELIKISTLATTVTVNALPDSGVGVVHVTYPAGGGATDVRGTNGADRIRIAGTPATGVTVFGIVPTVLIDPQAARNTLTVIGAGGDDVLDANGLADGVTSLTEFGDLNGTNPGNDTLIGTPGADGLFGGPGIDTIDGRGGADTIIQDGP